MLVATKNKMDLALNIAIGSSTQIALFVAPVLVLLSFAVGTGPWRSSSPRTSSARRLLAW